MPASQMAARPACRSILSLVPTVRPLVVEKPQGIILDDHILPKFVGTSHIGIAQCRIG